MKKFVMIILAALLLPINISAEEMLLPFFEDCADLAHTSARSEKLMATPHTDEEWSFTDDFSFIQRTELSAQWLTYAVPKGGIITVSTYFWSGEALSHFNFYLSDDGENFRQVKPRIKVHPKIEGKWLTVDYKIKNPEDTYIKIEFQNLGGNTWNPALRSIKCEEEKTSEKFYDVTDKSTFENLLFLEKLGILSGYEDGSYRPGEKVSRSAFTASIIKFMNMSDRCGDCSGYTYFNDVEKDSWYAPYVNMAVSCGIVDVNDEKMFYPDRPVSNEEALKMLVCVLGYGQYAEAVGGWPLGYISVAGDIKLDRNISKSEFTRKSLVHILKNALDAPMFIQQSFGENITYSKGESALWHFYKLKSVTSMLTDNGITALTGESRVSSGEVILGQERYSCKNADIKDLLGHTIKAYTNNENEIIHFTDETEDIFKMSADEIEDFDNNIIKSKTAKINVTPDTRIIYNGEFLAAVGDINLANYRPSDGEIKIIGSPAKVVFIKNYEVLVTAGGGVFDKCVYGRFTGEHILNLDACSFVKIVRDGEETADTSYNVDEVLQIARSSGGKYAEIIITTDAVIGTVTSIGENELRIDGRMYETAPHYSLTLQMQSGESGYFYQDRNGRIVWGDKKSSPYDNYAYVIKSKLKEDIVCETEIKLFTENGKTEIYTLDARVSPPADGTVIKYSLSTDGKINKIETLEDDYSGTSLYHNDVFSSLYNMTADSVIFVIPEDKAFDEGYMMRKKDFLRATKRYNIELYDVNADYHTKLAIVHQNGSDLSELTNYTAINIIAKTAKILNASGDEVYLLTLGDGRQVKISSREVDDITSAPYCKNKILHTGMQGNSIVPGDILQFGLDENGDINAVRFLFTPSAENFYEWVTGEWGAASENNFFAETAAFYGTVDKKQDGRIIAYSANRFRRNLPVSSAAVFLLGNAKLKSADLTDINPGDEIACGMLSGSVKIILKL